jgi:hypothetical protein
MNPDGFAIIYDLQDAHAWHQARTDRLLWGRRFCQHYMLGEERLVTVFMPGGARWASWETRRKRQILAQDPEGRVA